MPGILIHILPESLFTSPRNRYPHAPEYALLLGDGRTMPPAAQEELAMSYLASHRQELRNLQCFPGVENLTLGLVRICPVEATGIAVTPSVRLAQQAEELGIDLTYYVTIDGRSHT